MTVPLLLSSTGCIFVAMMFGSLLAAHLGRSTHAAFPPWSTPANRASLSLTGRRAPGHHSADVVATARYFVRAVAFVGLRRTSNCTHIVQRSSPVTPRAPQWLAPAAGSAFKNVVRGARSSWYVIIVGKVSQSASHGDRDHLVGSPCIMVTTGGTGRWGRQCLDVVKPFPEQGRNRPHHEV